LSHPLRQKRTFTAPPKGMGMAKYMSRLSGIAFEGDFTHHSIGIISLFLLGDKEISTAAKAEKMGKKYRQITCTSGSRSKGWKNAVFVKRNDAHVLNLFFLPGIAELEKQEEPI